MTSCRKIPDVSQWLLYEERFINPDLPTGLWFCEDAEAVHTVGINAVCLPINGSWNDLFRCRAFIRRFPYVVVVAADPEKRRVMQEEVHNRLNYISVLVAPGAGFKGCASVAELCGTCGYKAVEELLCGAVELPAYGLLNLAEVEKPEVWRLPRVKSGIPELDKAIGGFLMGELTVWTGRRGEGKSTLIGQLLTTAIDQGRKVCAYSGELPAWRFKDWASLQAAGPQNITAHEDGETGKTFYSVAPHLQKRIDAWWDARFILYDLGISSAHDEDSILDAFTLAFRKYGCDVFLVDNIMTARLKGTKDADYYRAQSSFAGRLVSFAKRYNVHVHLVAHPRKTTNKSLEADDVGGTGDITNRADNVLSLKRMPDNSGKEYGTLLSVLKNRAFGNTVKIGLNFEPASRRFYKAGTGSPDWRYGWEYDGEQIAMPEDGDAEDPFQEDKP